MTLWNLSTRLLQTLSHQFRVKVRTTQLSADFNYEPAIYLRARRWLVATPPIGLVLLGYE